MGKVHCRLDKDLERGVLWALIRGSRTERNCLGGSPIDGFSLDQGGAD